MAPKDDDAWKRYRDREDEKEDEDFGKPGKHGQVGKPGSAGTFTSEKLDELVARAEPMIDQLGNLYNMFASGAERAAPTERRLRFTQCAGSDFPSPSVFFNARLASLSARLLRARGTCASWKPSNSRRSFSTRSARRASRPFLIL